MVTWMWSVMTEAISECFHVHVRVDAIHTPFLSASCRHSPKSDGYLRLCSALSAPADAWLRYVIRSLLIAFGDDVVQIGDSRNQFLSRTLMSF